MCVAAFDDRIFFCVYNIRCVIEHRESRALVACQVKLKTVEQLNRALVEKLVEL